ncbi:LysR family transcriptional regulator [Acetobacter senegalensis]|uniref:LysR family transcriptional regulator n=1 Tax=Acetobacter senegalensis TaxID=446692 RepID=A0A149U7W3_9PROT|nr:LysR family transcriptional regulator [Acetobacter senegalensis]KXV61396.1 LysR family transcriptional regulator [Acetobacter senegalensis]MCG4256701.1 LysR family transcriptional regulator [Acetobacter senegalensis]MCG4266738.1 LysR family transcriptional regulator [Acetobacter senegalensis]MPQ74637.1 LysR family transcriptional regulator [Acetobacter senegalensis]
MLDRLTSMKVFIKVVELGSFAAAAQRLTLSPQMVAKHIEALERHLGTRLLHRTTRRQSLTEIGRLYYEQCHLVLKAVERADNLAANTLGEPRGTLAVSVPVTFGRTTFPMFLHNFRKKFPKVRLQVSLTDQLVHPTLDGHEAVIRIGEPDPDLTVVSRPLASYSLTVCAAPAYLEKFGAPDSPEELAQHQCLVYENSANSVRTAWHFIRKTCTRSVMVSGTVTSNDWGFLLALTLSGEGIVLGSEQALKPELDSGRLVRILSRWRVPGRPMHLLYNAGPAMTPKLRSFVTEVQNAFPP